MDAAKVSPGYTQGKPADQELENGPIENRGCTDILCCLLFIASVIAMLVIAIQAYTKGQPQLLAVPQDSSGKSCGIDYPGYPYIQFVTPQPGYLNRTVCVSSCPNYNESQQPTGAPTSLSCQTNTVVTSCTGNCGNITTQWPPSGTVFSDLVCIYSTTELLGRMCFPVDILQVLSSYNMQSEFSSAISANTLSEWLNDTYNAWTLILASVGMALVLGLFFLLFVRVFSGLIVWLCILIFFAAIAGLGYLAQLKSQDIAKASNSLYQVSGSSDYDNYWTFRIISFVLWGVDGLCFIFFLCIINKIKLAIAIIKSATLFIKDCPLTLLIPPIFVAIQAGYAAWWIVSAIFLYSEGTVTQDGQYPFATIQWSTQTTRMWWYFLFGGLWTNAFIQSLCQFILASTVCIWYFSYKSGQLHSPISRSVYRAFRYHLGSLAFGALLLAIIQFIRIMLEYIYQQTKSTGGNNRCFKYFLDCLMCLAACFERFIRFLNRNAYIMIALTGKNFCTAAKDAMEMIWGNIVKYALVGGIGSAFIIVGKLFVVLVTTCICYYILTRVTYYDSMISSAILPIVLIFIISYAIATIMMSVYGMAMDAILMCYILDEKLQGQKGSTKAFHAPEPLQEFMEAHGN